MACTSTHGKSQHRNHESCRVVSPPPPNTACARAALPAKQLIPKRPKRCPRLSSCANHIPASREKQRSEANTRKASRTCCSRHVRRGSGAALPPARKARPNTGGAQSAGRVAHAHAPSSSLSQEAPGHAQHTKHPPNYAKRRPPKRQAKKSGVCAQPARAAPPPAAKASPVRSLTDATSGVIVMARLGADHAKKHRGVCYLRLGRWTA